jgi:hypothetical protein
MFSGGYFSGVLGNEKYLEFFHFARLINAPDAASETGSPWICERNSQMGEENYIVY